MKPPALAPENGVPLEHLDIRPAPGAFRPARDPARVAEVRALCAAIARFGSLRTLHGAPAWPALAARYRALLDVAFRYEAPAPAAAADAPAGGPAPLRVAHWNIEHGNRYAAIERALLSHPGLVGADVVMLNEVDLGMSRAANRDVTGDLAQALGYHAVFAPQFVESTVGRDDDALTAGGGPNQESLFGLAILSRWPIGGVRLVPMPGPERIQFDLERMVGRFVAVVAEVRRPGAPFVAVASHLEVHRTRRHRAAQIACVARVLAAETRPVVWAGDFNTHTFDRGLWHTPLAGAWPLLAWTTPALSARLLHPDRGAHRETLFAELERAGFAWAPYADFAPSLSVRFDRLEELHVIPAPLRPGARRMLAWAERRAQLRLDWICGRGWRDEAGRGWTVPGLDGPGIASDHAPLVAELIGR